MGILNFIKNHRSFLLTLTGVILFVFFGIILLSSPLLRNLIAVNAPYALVFIFLCILPVLVVKKLGWYPEAARQSSWIVLFLITGVYYAIFRSPNVIGFFFDLFTARIEAKEVYSLITGTMVYSGIFTFFYSVNGYRSARKDNLFVLKVDPKSFVIWTLTYLLYLNAMTSIINPVFRRPV